MKLQAARWGSAYFFACMFGLIALLVLLESIYTYILPVSTVSIFLPTIFFVRELFCTD